MAGQSALPGGGGAAEEVLVGGTAARLQITLQTGRKKILIFYDLRYENKNSGCHGLWRVLRFQLRVFFEAECLLKSNQKFTGHVYVQHPCN